VPAMNVAILIPAYNPDEKLVKLVFELANKGFVAIIVVNDASRKESIPIFEDVSKINKTIIIGHAINKGQGGALKTGLEYILLNFKNIVGVIHCDADGQHSVKDIVRTARELEENPDELILGVREFRGDIPFRSKFGNRLTCLVLRLLFGIQVSDTQTGMRGIPAKFIPALLDISYNRFEFNTEMLLVSRKANIPIRELPIETIYIDKNASSHFNPLLDSVKIYFVLFRYLFASILTALADYSVFILSYRIFENILFTNYFSRLIALSIQYMLVSKLVFISQEKMRKTFPKYLLLVIISGFISSAIISYLTSKFSMNIITSKFIAEALLYLANFIIQRELIFVDKREF